MDITWDPTHTDQMVVVLTLAAVVATHHFVTGRERFERWVDGVTAVVLERLAGAVLYGIVPLMVLALAGISDIGAGLGDIARWPLWLAGLAAVILTFIAAFSRTKGFGEHYPHMPLKRWTASTWLQNAGSWAVFLVAYEFLFRGFCLFTLAAAWGVWPAIAVTTALYVLTHLPANGSETLGSMLMGFGFGLLALAAGSFWPAAILHILIALTAETASLIPARD
jgi:membrane protease YdiL (CAAX protease family)